MRRSQQRRGLLGILAVALCLCGGVAHCQSPVSDGFDYPVGWPNGSAFYDAQDFRVNNHLGEDWNGVGGGNSDCGAAVRAISNGTVVYSNAISTGWSGWGNLIIIRHQLPDGSLVESMYAHLDERRVSTGEQVARGQLIGTIGDGDLDGCNAGASSADPHTGYYAHLHFEIRESDCRSWGSPGPGYSSDSSGWLDPSTFIDAHRQLSSAKVPLVGNWDGVGEDETGYYDPLDCTFHLAGLPAIQFGMPGDKPISGDWDKDGLDEIGLYRPVDADAGGQSTFYLDLDNSGGPADRSFSWGAYPDEIPVAGDWENDGDDDVAGFQDGVFYLWKIDTASAAIGTYYTSVAYGIIGDLPISGDWDADGDDDLGIARRTATTIEFYLDQDLAGTTEWGPEDYGNADDVPIAGRPDGSENDKIGIYRPSTEQFFFSDFPQLVLSDTTAPPPPIGLSANPNSWTCTNSFQINWTNPSDPSGIVAAWYKKGSAPTHSADGTRTTSHPFTTTASAEGGQTLYVWLEDGAGNKNHVNRSTTPLYYDATRPTCGLSINSNASTTTSLIVTLSPNGADSGGSSLYQMRFSNNNIDWSNWQTYNTTKSDWDLSGNGGNSNAGVKTTYCQVKDNAGNEVSSSCSDTITYAPLDTTAPQPPIGLSASPNSWTNTNSFQINWTNPSDPSGIVAAWYKKGSAPAHSADGTRTTSHPFTTTASVEGGETLYVWLEDGAGNKSHANRSTTPLYYDATRPTCGLSINNNVSTTNSLIVTLSPNAIDLGGSGRYQMRFSNNNSDWSPWETYNTTRSNWDLSGNGGNTNEGTKTAYCEVSDSAGNVVSPSCSDTINYTPSDTTAPTPDPMTWSQVPSVTGATTISMTATTATDPSSVEYSFEETSGNPGGNSSGWQDSATYSDDGLQASTQYCYRVKARDKSANQNETGWSSVECVKTGPPSTSAVFRVDNSGDVFADQTFYGSAFESASADIAEWVRISTPAESGDVVELDPIAPQRYRISANACSSLVAGVISTTPGVTLGTDLGTSEKALLALVGIVPVKVTDEGGPIEPGDLLVTSSTPGHAMRWAGPDPCFCSLVGKALEPMDGEQGVILVLLTAH